MNHQLLALIRIFLLLGLILKASVGFTTIGTSEHDFDCSFTITQEKNKDGDLIQKKTRTGKVEQRGYDDVYYCVDEKKNGRFLSKIELEKQANLMACNDAEGETCSEEELEEKLKLKEKRIPPPVAEADGDEERVGSKNEDGGGDGDEGEDGDEDEGRDEVSDQEVLAECRSKADRADLCCLHGGVAACVGDSPHLAIVDTYTQVGVGLAQALANSPHNQDEHKALQKSENYAHAQAGLLDARAAACGTAIGFCQNSCSTSNLFEASRSSGIEKRMLSLANRCAGLSSQAASLATQAANLHLVAQGYRKQRKALKGGEEIVEKGFCSKYPDSAICKSLKDTEGKDVVSVEEGLESEDAEDTSAGVSGPTGDDILKTLAKIKPPEDFGDLDQRHKAGPSGSGTSRAVGSVSSGGGGSGTAKKSPPPTSYEPPAFAPKSSKEVGKFLKGSGSGGAPRFYGNSDRGMAGFGDGLFAKKKRKKKKSFKEKSLMIGQILNRGQRDLAFKEENIFKLINRTYHAVCTAQMLDCPLEEDRP